MLVQIFVLVILACSSVRRAAAAQRTPRRARLSTVERGMNDDKTLFYSSMIGYRRKLLRSTWLVKALFVDVLSYFFAAE